MHITLLSQNVLQFIFIALIALPLPLIMLATPLQNLHDMIMRYRYYRILKKHVENPYEITEEKLSRIFPNKTTSELQQIAEYL